MQSTVSHTSSLFHDRCAVFALSQRVFGLFDRMEMISLKPVGMSVDGTKNVHVMYDYNGIR